MKRKWTRKTDKFPCRLAGGCCAEEWFFNHMIGRGDIDGNLCDDCPFEKLINALAEYEDKEENENE